MLAKKTIYTAPYFARELRLEKALSVITQKACTKLAANGVSQISKCIEEIQEIDMLPAMI